MKSKFQKGFSQLFVLFGMSFLALSLPLATYLVSQSQENRSRAADVSTSKVSFKIAFKGVKPSYTGSSGNNYNCLSSLDNIKVEAVNKPTNTYESNIEASFTPVSGETNSEGDQVFLISNLILDSKFNSVNTFNYLRIKGSRHLASRMCLDNQDKKLDEVTVCDINLSNTNTTVYDFSEYALTPGDINQDGVVNSSDYSVIKNNFNNTEITCGIQGDLNYDGRVNSLDAGLLKDALSIQEDGTIETTAVIQPITSTPTVTGVDDSINEEENNENIADEDTDDNEEEENNSDNTTTPEATPTPDNKVYDPITPPNNKYESSKSDTSDTLKVWTTKYDGYYLIRIWAKNPYLQYHQYSAKMSGKTHDTIENLFNGALKKNGVKDKIAVAFNSDPSVYYNSYYYCRHSVHKECPFNSYTSGGLIIRDGETYRDDRTTNGKRNLTYTITQNNKMVVLTDKYNLTEEKRSAVYKPIIDGGARNTGSALHIMIDDGKKLSSSNNPKKYSHLYKASSSATAYRTAMCQIDNNNFVYLSTTSKTEKFLADKMMDLGCRIAVNIDGGGSTNFWFKKDTSNSWTHVRGSGSRGRMDSVAYWTEL